MFLRKKYKAIFINYATAFFFVNEFMGVDTYVVISLTRAYEVSKYLLSIILIVISF